MPSTHLSLHFHVVFSTKNRENIRSYIGRQEEHHRKRTFQEEYLELLHRCGVDFDDRYLWQTETFRRPSGAEISYRMRSGGSRHRLISAIPPGIRSRDGAIESLKALGLV